MAMLVEVTVFYLEMRSPPQRIVEPPRDGLVVLHVESPSAPYYRFLYAGVGKDYHWQGRKKLPDDELATILGDPADEVYVLHVAGSPAGFSELDRRKQGDIELVQFGLMPEFTGQGLGKWFLHWTLEKAWSYQPGRLWLHTCTLDHPAAVPLYKGTAFEQFREESTRREL